MATDISETQTHSHFAEPATATRLDAVARALEANGFATQVVATAADAKQAVLDLVPLGSEVHTGASVTLEALGLLEEFESGRYDSTRPKYLKLDRRTQMPELRKLLSAPQYMLASASAVTESGSLVLASATGMQLGAVACGASVVIFVIGAQKIVRDLDEGLRRVDAYCLPLEDERAMRIYGAHSSVNKLLILNKENPGRVHLILVKEPLGY
jgi:L-lactate utilization protein LutC